MKLYLLFFMLFLVGMSYAQDIPSNYQTKKIAIADTVVLDKVSINPLQFQILDNKGMF